MTYLAPVPFSVQFLQALEQECLLACTESLPVRESAERQSAYAQRYAAAQRKPLLLVRTLDTLIDYELGAGHPTSTLLSHQEALIQRFALPTDRQKREKLLNRKKVLTLAMQQGEISETAPQDVLPSVVPGDPSVIGAQNKGADPKGVLTRPRVVRRDLAQRLCDLFPHDKK